MTAGGGGQGGGKRAARRWAGLMPGIFVETCAENRRRVGRGELGEDKPANSKPGHGGPRRVAHAVSKSKSLQVMAI